MLPRGVTYLSFIRPYIVVGSKAIVFPINSTTSFFYKNSLLWLRAKYSYLFWSDLYIIYIKIIFLRLFSAQKRMFSCFERFCSLSARLVFQNSKLVRKEFHNVTSNFVLILILWRPKWFQIKILPKSWYLRSETAVCGFVNYTTKTNSVLKMHQKCRNSLTKF